MTFFQSVQWSTGDDDRDGPLAHVSCSAELSDLLGLALPRGCEQAPRPGAGSLMPSLFAKPVRRLACSR